MPDYKSLRPVLPILIGVSLVLSLAMGMRQSLGIFLQPLTRDIGISVSQFTIAIAVQNLTWGLLQPISGAWASRMGLRITMLLGVCCYVVGLILLATAQGLTGVILGAGVAIGAAMSCTGSAISLAVAARAVEPGIRLLVLGFVSAAGSLGALLAAPIGQALTQGYGWRVGAAAFVVIALLMLPAAWVAGRVDRLPVPPTPGGIEQTGRAALGSALRHSSFMVLTLAYFVCGMQLIFLSTHLPSYLEICGMDPMLSAKALGVIGGFNVLGSLFFGWAGTRYNKLMLLGGIYIARSIALGWYFMSSPTPGSTLVFAAIMGFLWLGVVPLIFGWIGETFGVRWQAMLGGVAFMSHQIGSFTGAFGGGLIYDLSGSYNAAWQIGVGVGLLAGMVQVGFAWSRPRPPLPPAAVAA
jgi:predicted MFS family arabinose efflux permease